MLQAEIISQLYQNAETPAHTKIICYEKEIDHGACTRIHSKNKMRLMALPVCMGANGVGPNTKQTRAKRKECLWHYISVFHIYQ